MLHQLQYSVCYDTVISFHNDVLRTTKLRSSSGLEVLHKGNISINTICITQYLPFFCHPCIFQDVETKYQLNHPTGIVLSIPFAPLRC